VNWLEEVFKGGVSGLLAPIADIIAKFKADPTIMAQNGQKVIELEYAAKQVQLQAELQLQLAQAKINEVEAASPDKFKSWARPAALWVCVVGFAYANLGYPLLGWLSINMGWKPPLELNTNALDTMLAALLGVGAYRSFDKWKGSSK